MKSFSVDFAQCLIRIMKMSKKVCFKTEFFFIQKSFSPYDIKPKHTVKVL